MDQITKESFLEDVKNHKVEVLRNDGVYRHIRCGYNTGNRWFDIITYPNHLVISGDMGTNVFSRESDMFKFFNQKVEDGIKPRYWSEKLQDDKNHGKEFSQDALLKSLNKEIIRICNDIDEEYSDRVNVSQLRLDFIAEVKNYLKYEDLDEHRFIRIIEEFESDVLFQAGIDIERPFEDWSEWLETERYNYHFIWRLWAIVWTIEEFRKFKSKDKNKA